jgi:Peptidase family M28
MNLRLFAFPLVLALSIVAAIWLAMPPPVRGGEADARFSVSRALVTNAEISAAPHVTGSAENARVRDVLVGKLRAFGLNPEIQSATGLRQHRYRSLSTSVAPVENIIAVLAGRDRSAPAVALVAHYDTAAFSPGASDDGAGTAALIETARVLSQGPVPARDVVFLITDGEEIGLLGAEVFFTQHPLAPRIGAVVNAEMRGSRGRAWFFQSSAGNAELIRLWRQNVISPSGNSLAELVYRNLPNDTDLSVPLALGRIGLNAAANDGEFDYHSPTDTHANLDPRTLQHLGDFALEMTRALAMAEQLPARAGDAVFFDVFSLGVVQYPAMFGWFLVALAFVGMAALERRGGAPGWRPTLVALLTLFAATTGLAVASHFLAGALYGPGNIAARERVAEVGVSFWIYLAFAVGMMLVLKPGIASGRAALWLMFVLAVIAQALAPGAAWLLIWPVLVAVIINLVAQRFGPSSTPALACTAALGGAAFAFVFQTLPYAFYVAVGALTSGVVALCLPFAIVLLWPLAAPWYERPRGIADGRRAGFAMLAGGALAIAATALSSGFSARHPRPGDLFHITDADTGAAWFATGSTGAELPPGARARPRFAVFGNYRPWATPAPAHPAPAPMALTMRAGPDGRSVFRLSSAKAARAFRLNLKPDADLQNITINGQPVLIPADEWSRLNFRAAVPLDLVIAFDTPREARLDVAWYFAAEGLPPGSPAPAGAPTDWTALSGTSITTASRTYTWR